MLKKAVNCPRCGNVTFYLFKCKFCGDVRCKSQATCVSSHRQKGCYAQNVGAFEGGNCRACKRVAAYQSLE